jgi:adenylate kinase family enzyme
MRRVLVLGSGGAGKSVFARRLGEMLNIEVKHLDKFYWRRGWTEPSKDEWLQTVIELTHGDSWIIDGNYSGTIEARIQRCDTIIFLDMPRWLCLWRVVKRRLLYPNGSRPDMAEGCPEQLNPEFLSWIWNYSRRSKPKIVRLINRYSENRRIVWLRSTAEVERFLSTGLEDFHDLHVNHAR